MGVYTNATGAGSFAAGYNNNAKGQNSVAIGSENTSHVQIRLQLVKLIMLRLWVVFPSVKTT